MNRDRTKKMRNRSAQKQPIETAEFDREFIADTFQPLSAEDQARWDKARSHGDGADNQTSAIAINIDPTLLDHVEALAKKLGVSRDCLIARGIKAVLIAAGES